MPQLSVFFKYFGAIVLSYLLFTLALALCCVNEHLRWNGFDRSEWARCPYRWRLYIILSVWYAVTKGVLEKIKKIF